MFLFVLFVWVYPGGVFAVYGKPQWRGHNERGLSACMDCLRSIKITLVVFHISLRFPCVRVSGDREGAVEERILGKMIRVAQLRVGVLKFIYHQ